MRRIVRWNSPLDNFFEDFLNAVPSAVYENGTTQNITTPALDVIDGDDQIELMLNLPGVNPDDVTIEFNKGILEISTLDTTNPEATEANYTRRERFHGAYKRNLRVPDSINAEAATAHFQNGVLTLTLPKKPEAQPHRIPVSISQN